VRDFKKGQRLLCKRNEVRYHFIQSEARSYPVRLLCRVMKVSKSAFYAWKARPGHLITAQELQIYRRTKALFNASRESLGSREIEKKLRSEGFNVSRDRASKIRAKLGLKAKQRRAYKATTKRKHDDAVADNLLSQNFNSVGRNQVRAGDITYLKTTEGCLYPAVVMDLYSRRIVGWAADRRMTTSLISRALTIAYKLRQPAKGLIFHSDRGSQYTSSPYRKLLLNCGIRASMVDVGACSDNAVVERFFGSLKYDWIFKSHQPTREPMANDVRAYIKYYNLERFHSSNDDLSPIQFENLVN
jgi:putative transposase